MSERGGIWRSLRARDRRAIRWGLVVLVPALVLGAGLPPYVEALEGGRDQLAVERALLARERRLLADAARGPVQRSAIETALERRLPQLFVGDPTLAAGALVRYVAQEAARSGVSLEALETAGTEAAGPGVVGVGVRLRGVGDIAGVMELLRRLEDGSALIRIERLSLERREGYPGAGGGNADDEVQVVVLGATVLGYTLVTEGSVE